MRNWVVSILLLSGLAVSAQPDPQGLLAPNTQTLTAADVTAAISAAAHAVNSSTMVIAVTDRQGNPLGVFRRPDAPATALGNFSQQVDSNELAVALARTASFFSNSQAPLSSRTVRFISGIHFPPGVMYVANAALYGIENTNRGCSFNVTYDQGKALPTSRTIDQSQAGLGVITGKKDVYDSDPYAVNPGGVPLYKGGRLVGGIGVTGVAGNVAEYAAFVGATGSGLFQAPPAPGVVFIDGIALPFVNQSTQPAGTSPVSADQALTSLGSFVAIPQFAGMATMNATWQGRGHGTRTAGETVAPAATTTTVAGPQDSPGVAPEGYLVTPQAGPVGGLSQADVQNIVSQTLAIADTTRAVIRLPLGTRAKFVIAVADLDGKLIALYRMKDATIFSVDVAVAKSRNVIYFSGPTRTQGDLPGVPIGTAVTNRTISFGAQPLFPPGIDYSGPGPFFPLYQYDTAHPCTQGAQPPNANQNGIVFFPGALPLYRNGQLIGGLGVSGDGVEQDDFATNGGAAGFYADPKIRADQVIINGVRLPYIKFPRNPTL